MHVEDHPIEYGEFEGVIPPKQYGSGTVLLWDRGDVDTEGGSRRGLPQGQAQVRPATATKLHGGWTLVKSRSGKYGGEKSWLLIKEDDEHARSGIDARVVDDLPDSVASGRSLEEIAAIRTGCGIRTSPSPRTCARARCARRSPRSPTSRA
jgi:bifunctional non-homologous end joining protein LigD